MYIKKEGKLWLSSLVNGKSQGNSYLHLFERYRGYIYDNLCKTSNFRELILKFKLSMEDGIFQNRKNDARYKYLWKSIYFANFEHSKTRNKQRRKSSMPIIIVPIKSIRLASPAGTAIIPRGTSRPNNDNFSIAVCDVMSIAYWMKPSRWLRDTNAGMHRCCAGRRASRG